METENAKQPILSWIAHPARYEKTKLLLALGLIFTTAIVIYVGFQSMFYSILALIFLILSITSFITPTRYEIWDDRIIAHGLFSKSTKEFHTLKRMEVSKTMIFLSPFQSPSRLDSFRGMVLKVYENKEAVISTLKERLKI
jgi:heme O synthase-like polyprenyltransferase